VVQEGIDPGPLAGVPIGLKDLIDQEGIPTTNGAAFEPKVPDRSATVVARLEDAGAVIIGRNGLHEFAYGFTSENEHFGPVRNPWDTKLSPGGSSGGSGASVAAGVVVASVGTDTGGSVRVPAALCGVVGLKVTYGRVPLTGVTPLAPSLDTIGPIARSVADLASMYGVMAGVDLTGGEPIDLKTLRIGVPMQWNAAVIDRATASAFEGALDRVATSGATVEEVDAPGLAITDVAAGAVAVEILETHRERWPKDADRYGTDVARRLRDAEAVPRRYAIDVPAWDATARETLGELFESFDVLATPTVGATRKVIGEQNIDIDGEAVFHRTVLSSYTWPVNRPGNPALAVPIPDSGAPPASLQLIGPRLGEERLLSIGMGLEDAGLVAVEKAPIFFE
jgi:aspartyl-tRNA(Asn)/glutamyl-tRNA(Gln) amidotransferase subunit A